jgi:hypothetical protein
LPNELPLGSINAGFLYARRKELRLMIGDFELLSGPPFRISLFPQFHLTFFPAVFYSFKSDGARQKGHMIAHPSGTSDKEALISWGLG